MGLFSCFKTATKYDVPDDDTLLVATLRSSADTHVSLKDGCGVGDSQIVSAADQVISDTQVKGEIQPVMSPLMLSPPVDSMAGLQAGSWQHAALVHVALVHAAPTHAAPAVSLLCLMQPTSLSVNSNVCQAGLPPPGPSCTANRRMSGLAAATALLRHSLSAAVSDASPSPGGPAADGRAIVPLPPYLKRLVSRRGQSNVSVAALAAAQFLAMDAVAAAAPLSHDVTAGTATMSLKPTPQGHAALCQSDNEAGSPPTLYHDALHNLLRTYAGGGSAALRRGSTSAPEDVLALAQGAIDQLPRSTTQHQLPRKSLELRAPEEVRTRASSCRISIEGGRLKLALGGRPSTEVRGRLSTEVRGRPSVEVRGRPCTEVRGRPSTESHAQPSAEGCRKSSIEIRVRPSTEVRVRLSSEITAKSFAHAEGAAVKVGGNPKLAPLLENSRLAKLMMATSSSSPTAWQRSCSQEQQDQSRGEGTATTTRTSREMVRQSLEARRMSREINHRQ